MRAGLSLTLVRREMCVGGVVVNSYLLSLDPYKAFIRK